MGKADKLARASISIARARQMLARARDDLARASPVGSPAVLVDPAHAEIHAALERHKVRLLRIPGVVGFGVGFRELGGVRTDEPCITVNVRAKWSRARLAKEGRRKVPSWLRSPTGNRIPVDVVAVGRLRRHLLAGSSMGRMQRPTTRGTIGSFATDLESGAVVALSAMHVSGLNGFPPGPSITLATPSPPSPGAYPMGVLGRGTTSQVDAMRVELLDPGAAKFAIHAIGPIRGWRPVTSGDQSTTVRMFGAESGFQQGAVESPIHHLPAFGLDPVILVRIHSVRGDSGAAIVDDRRLVLGLLIGGLTGAPLCVFSPIGNVLMTLGCDINPEGGS